MASRGACLIRPVLALLLATGCAAFPSKPESHPHLVVHKDGYPLTDRGELLSDEAFRTGTIPAILAELDKYIETEHRNGGTPQLLLYVHGGLTSYKDGIEDIGKFLSRDTSRIRGTNFYPIFITWDSSPGSTWYDDIFEIRHGERNPYWVLGYLTAPFQLLSRFFDSLTGSPVTVAYMLDTAWESWGEEGQEGEVVSGEDRAKYWVGFIPTIPTRIMSTGLLVGYGKGAWEMMKRRIDRMFALEMESAGPRRGAVRIFLEALARKMPWPGTWRIRPGTEVPVEISLMGHSMGTIVINRILREFPDIGWEWIAYMGGASSIDDFRDSVVPYLRQHSGARFYSFSLALKDESTEGRPKRWFPVLPGGSLLVWIDQMFEPGLSPEHKRLGWWRNRKYIVVDSTDPGLCSRMTFFKFPGEPGDPRMHGHFNDGGHLQRIIHMTGDEWRRQCPACVTWSPCVPGR